MNFKGIDWREEYARYLDAIGNYEDALRQVSYVEAQGGLTPQLKQLKDVLEQEMSLSPRPPG
jgi:hypothetical protein